MHFRWTRHFYFPAKKMFRVLTLICIYNFLKNTFAKVLPDMPLSLSSQGRKAS